MLFNWRRNPAAETPADADRLYRQAADLVWPLIQLDDRRDVELTPATVRKLRQGIVTFGRVLSLRHADWPSMWLLGKAHQRLGELDTALLWFARAHFYQPAQPDIAREASIAAMQLGRPRDAVRFCERAISVKPDDTGLRANLALALLFSGEVSRASAIATDALRQRPTDRITQRIVKVCGEVEAGKRPCPHHVREL